MVVVVVGRVVVVDAGRVVAVEDSSSESLRSVASVASVLSGSDVSDASSVLAVVASGAESVADSEVTVVAAGAAVIGGSVVEVVVVTASGEIRTSFAGVVGRPAIAAPASAPTTTTSGIVCQFRFIGCDPNDRSRHRRGTARSADDDRPDQLDQADSSIRHRDGHRRQQRSRGSGRSGGSRPSGRLISRRRRFVRAMRRTTR